MELKGKVVWITGGANGIGAATARRLAGLGALPVLSDVDAEIDGEFPVKVWPKMPILLR